MGFSLPISSRVLLLFTLLVFTTRVPTSWGKYSIISSSHGDFVDCISLYEPPNSIPILSPNNSSFFSILESSARNRRFLSPTYSKPRFIVAPLHESQVQAVVVCSRKHGLDVRVRSGGHDLEGLCFINDDPFVLVDLINLRSIDVDVENSIAWVQAGASLGELYNAIGQKSKTLAFPGGLCPTVGVGGHFSGGGQGTLVRKYGLASDQIIDALIVNANGEILDKQTMGEDLFWAIRGGGAASFAVVLSWKVKLVPVPAKLNVATIFKTHEQGAINIFHRWQFVADRLPENIYIGLEIMKFDGTTMQARFTILFLGDNTNELVDLMEENFPELGLKHSDCTQVSWLESHPHFYQPWDEPPPKMFFKGKSDNVQVPISKQGLEGLWTMLLEETNPTLYLTPLGGRMNKISESQTPFPHRVGNIYNIFYCVIWFEESDSGEKHIIDWMRRLYEYMTPYVSNSPRTPAGVNYIDLDLGHYKNGEVMNYSQAQLWGIKYFKDNFKRLAQVKSKVDPDNFFKHRQSIPPIQILSLTSAPKII